MPFVVYEDLDKADGPKVHSEDCDYYQNWLANPTTTTTWHGPFETYEKAWEKCTQLAKETRFKPSTHNCVRFR